MAKRLPRLEVIEAFIEAARAPNFRTAAERCALSPAAFSRRIQAFRAYVGHDLFERHAGGMRLTEAGRACLASLEPTYQAVRRATLELGRERAGRVTISLSHSMSVGWLIPRLSRFRALHPSIEVTIQTARTAEPVRLGDADIAVLGVDIDAGDLYEAHFLDVDVTPVSSPDIAKRVLEGRAHVEDFALFGVTQQDDLWRWWSMQTRAKRPLSETVRFDVVHAMYEAAAAGMGVAIGMSPTVGPHIETGRLVPLGLASARFHGGYRLATRPSRLRDTAVRALWAWMLSEAQAKAAQPALARG